MLQGGFSEVLTSRNRMEFEGELVAFTKRLGFEIVAATLVIDHLLGDAEFISITNAPRAYTDAFQIRKTAGAIRSCSTSSGKACRSSGNQATYVRHGLGDKWEEQAHFGISTGICLRCTCPRGAISCSASTETGRCRRTPAN